MRFTVNWTPTAENELADVWMNAPDQPAVNAASNRIDRILEVNAHLHGQECDGDRMLRVLPLIFFFAVSLDDRRVDILSVAHE